MTKQKAHIAFTLNGEAAEVPIGNAVQSGLAGVVDTPKPL